MQIICLSNLADCYRQETAGRSKVDSWLARRMISPRCLQASSPHRHFDLFVNIFFQQLTAVQVTQQSNRAHQTSPPPG